LALAQLYKRFRHSGRVAGQLRDRQVIERSQGQQSCPRAVDSLPAFVDAGIIYISPTVPQCSWLRHSIPGNGVFLARAKSVRLFLNLKLKLKLKPNYFFFTWVFSQLIRMLRPEFSDFVGMTTPPQNLAQPSLAGNNGVDGTTSSSSDATGRSPIVAIEPGPRTQALHWAGCTLNNYTELDVEKFASQLSPICVYWCFGKEKGDSGTPHLQFMFSLKAKKTLVSLKKIFPTAHFEVKSKKSTFKQASDYCKKDGDFIEWGVLPEDQGTSGRKVIADNYAETVDLAKKGDILAINPEHMLKYYATIKKIQHDFKKRPENLNWKEGEQPNFWIWGPTRTGKSHLAREMLAQKFYAKNAANKWWDKYDGEDNVLIEDMDLSHVYQGFYLKIWADKYSFPVEVKQSGDLIRPKVIIVTSNYSIRTIFPDPSVYEPLEARFKVIHKELPWNATINSSLSMKTPPKPKKSPTKKRKFDMPLKKPALLRRNAIGELVPGKQMQPTLEEVKMNGLADQLAITIEDTTISSSSDSDLISSDEDPVIMNSQDNSCYEGYDEGTSDEDHLDMEEDYNTSWCFACDRQEKYCICFH